MDTLDIIFLTWLFGPLFIALIRYVFLGICIENDYEAKYFFHEDNTFESLSLIVFLWGWFLSIPITIFYKLVIGYINFRKRTNKEEEIDNSKHLIE